MKCNLAQWDRILRFLLGIFLTSWVIAGGPFWGWIGVYLLASSGWGFCLVYASFKIATLKTEDERSVPKIYETGNKP